MSRKKAANPRKKLIAIRKSLGLTRKDIADALGIAETQYEKIETGLIVPRLDVAIRLGELLGAQIDELFEDLVPDKAGTNSIRNLITDRAEKLYFNLSRGDIDSVIAEGTG